MTRRTPVSAVIALGLMCCFNNINSAATGYFYQHPIKQFNPPAFSTLRSTGQYDAITYGAKVVASPRPRLTVPPIPSLPPLAPLTTKTQGTNLQSTQYTRVPTSPATYPRQQLHPTQAQPRQQPRQQYVQQQQLPQFIPTQIPTRKPYVYNPPQQQLSYTPHQSIPQYTPKTTIKLTPPTFREYTIKPTQSTPQKQTSFRPFQFVGSQQYQASPKLSVPTLPPVSKTFIPTNPTLSKLTIPSYTPHSNPFLPTSPTLSRLTVPSLTPRSNPFLPTSPTLSSVIIPSQPARSEPTVPIPSVGKQIKTISNPTQAVLAAGPFLESPDVYVIDGRQLKQYKVYEEIDNDIDQKIENFIPENFFLSNYHAKIGDTHPLGEDFQVQSRSSGPSFPQNSQPRQRLQQQPQQPLPNSIAIGSGGLGFVKLPNGNVYLGSGSLGYISNLQRNHDVVEARTRTGAPSPDAVHFGHGPLTDSLYYQ